MRNRWLVKNYREIVDITYRVDQFPRRHGMDSRVVYINWTTLISCCNNYITGIQHESPILRGSWLTRAHENVSILQGFLSVFAQQLENQPGSVLRCHECITSQLRSKCMLRVFNCSKYVRYVSCSFTLTLYHSGCMIDVGHQFSLICVWRKPTYQFFRGLNESKIINTVMIVIYSSNWFLHTVVIIVSMCFALITKLRKLFWQSLVYWVINDSERHILWGMIFQTFVFHGTKTYTYIWLNMPHGNIFCLILVLSNLNWIL